MISNIHEWVGCKDIEVRRSEFVAKTLSFFQFKPLYLAKKGTILWLQGIMNMKKQRV